MEAVASAGVAGVVVCEVAEEVRALHSHATSDFALLLLPLASIILLTYSCPQALLAVAVAEAASAADVAVASETGVVVAEVVAATCALVPSLSSRARRRRSECGCPPSAVQRFMLRMLLPLSMLL